MTEIELGALVDRTVKWANELGETWTGTTVGHVIDARKNHLQDLLKSNDLNLASIQVLELQEACKDAERINDGY